MKKIFVNFILLFLVILILFIFVLSTIGVETDPCGTTRPRISGLPVRRLIIDRDS